MQTRLYFMGAYRGRGTKEALAFSLGLLRAGVNPPFRPAADLTGGRFTAHDMVLAKSGRSKIRQTLVISRAGHKLPGDLHSPSGRTTAGRRKETETES